MYNFLSFLSISCFELRLNIKQYMYTQVYHLFHKTKKILGLREISPHYMDAMPIPSFSTSFYSEFLDKVFLSLLSFMWPYITIESGTRNPKFINPAKMVWPIIMNSIMRNMNATHQTIMNPLAKSPMIVMDVNSPIWFFCLNLLWIKNMVLQMKGEFWGSYLISYFYVLKG